MAINPEPQNLAPIANIDSISPNPATEGEIVSFMGYGYDSDGSIVSYSWESDIDGPLSTERSFSTSTLSVGEHTITFEVKDDEGRWSTSVTMTLVVQEKEEEGEGGGLFGGGTEEEDNSLLIIILLVIIALVIITLITIAALRRNKESSTSVMQISCPDCGSVFDVTSPLRPLKVQCSSCGVSGVLKE